MKRLLAFGLCVVLLLGISVPAFAADTAAVDYCGVNIVVDGARLCPKDADGKPVEPFIWNGTTYLPVRAVANALGLEVGWEPGTVKLTSGAERTAAIGQPIESTRSRTISIGGQDTKVTLDGTALDLKDAAGNPVTPLISDGTTYLPVRAVADALEVPVLWDGETATVYLGKAIEWKVEKETIDGLTSYYTYDDRGNILTATIDTVKETYTYDANNNMLTHIYVKDFEAFPENYSYTYTYDAAGNLLTEQYVDKIKPDEDYTFTYIYDAQGRECSRREVYSDGSEYLYTAVYDVAGNIIDENYHGDDYGHHHTYSYDTNGNVLIDRIVFDDGSYYLNTYTYDEKGNKLSWTNEVTNSEGKKGQTTYMYTYAYDENDRMTSYIEKRSGVNGDSYTEHRYTYDDNNHTFLAYEDWNGTISLTSMTYDVFGNCTLIVETVESDQLYRNTYTYSESNQLLTSQIIWNDGTETLTAYTYDQFGNVTRKEDQGSVTTYTYTPIYH